MNAIISARASHPRGSAGLGSVRGHRHLIAAGCSPNDALIRRDVVAIVNGLCDELQQESKRVPGQILYEADRLECLFFSGYDHDLVASQMLGNPLVRN